MVLGGVNIALYTSSNSLAKFLLSSFLNASGEKAADYVMGVFARLFSSGERKDCELQKLSKQVSEQRSQTQHLQSCIEQLKRNEHEQLQKCYTDLQENSNKIRELEEKYLGSQNSLKEMQFLKEQAEVVHEANIRTCKGLLRDKNEEIKKLSEGNSKLQNKLAIIEKNAADSSNTSGSYADSSATPVMLEAAVHKAQIALAKFSKCFQERCSSDGRDEEKHRVEILKGHNRFARSAHLKFAYQDLICRLLFAEFEKEDFNLNNGSCTVLDLKDLAIVSFQEYKYYCSAKLEDIKVEVVSTKPEKTNFSKFYGEKFNAVLAKHLASLPSTNDKFYYDFLELSQAVWTLHKLSFSFQPPARILRFERSSDYNSTCMESLLGAEDDPDFLPKVGLMTMAGFQIKNILIKCKIYPAGKENMA